MVESLHIEDLGVIEEADLPPSRDLTVPAGETGVGKTMVLTSLGLLLGQRVEITIVRSGAECSLVKGVFLVDSESRVAARVIETGGDLDDDPLLASRTVSASGRSRAHLGGHSVPALVLNEVGGRLVSVHGQADQLWSRSTAAQHATLDSLGGQDHAALCRRYARTYQERRQADQELQEWQASVQARVAGVAQLRTWLEALEEVDPRSGEDRESTAEVEKFDHAEDLRRAVTGVRTAFSGEESVTGQASGVVSLIVYAHRGLAVKSARGSALAKLATYIQQLGIDVVDIVAELGEYLSSLSADPARLARVQDHRGELVCVCREIGGPQEQLGDADAPLAWGQHAVVRLAEISGFRDIATALVEHLAAADEELASVGVELSQARQQLGERLEQTVTTELEGLEMKGARLIVELDRFGEPGSIGLESIALLPVPHPSAPALLLGKGTSGGKLSYIMLVLKAVLADAAALSHLSTHTRTFVFDEIDAKVGGRAVREIDRRLVRLVRHHQVTVVIHLTRAAAWASTHLVVRKEIVTESEFRPGPSETAARNVRKSQSKRTRTQVFAVEDQERQRELARMFSGHEDSQAAVRRAAELLQEVVMGQSEP